MRDAAQLTYEQGRGRFADMALRGHLADERLALRQVIELAVTSVFGVTRDELWFSSRGIARVALARQTAMYIAHTSGGLSLTEVGALFKRDRTTVAHACAVVEDRRDDPNFDLAIELMERAIVRLMSRQSAPRGRGFDA
jgi:chromosomal replication initiation ATPase DnaA